MSARDLPRIGAELGGYRIQSLLSRGGMAVVYLAEDVRMRRTVALKIIAAELAEDDAFRQRFLHESRIAGALNHPNVIPIYDAGEADGLLYIAMRHVEGIDLRGLLAAEGPLDLDRAASIITQTASALAAMHRRDLIHRDVKPANILLVPRSSPEGTDHVYLSDFGLAKHVGSTSGLTRTGQFLGTVDYVAPEQIQGDEVDARTDGYALGCVLFECLTGAAPFRRDEGLATIMAHVNDTPARVSDLRPGSPPAVDQVVSRSLAKDPAARYQSCDELSLALSIAAGRGSRAELALGDTEIAAPGTDAEPQREPEPEPDDPPIVAHRRRGVALLSIGLGTAALVAAGLVLVLGGDSRNRTAPVVRVRPTPPSTPAPAPVSGPWRAIAAAPTPRQQAAAAVVDGRLWVAGGLTGSTTPAATDRVEAYDPAIDSWNGAPALPFPLHHAMAVNYHNELVVLGGWTPRGANLTAIGSDRVLALRDGRWTRLPSLGRGRAAGAAAAVDGRIVVMGGQDRGRLLSVTEVFDGRHWRDGADIPTPRDHLAAVADRRYVYAVGGRRRSSDRNSGALERYDPKADRWSTLADMPSRAGGLGAAMVKGRIVALGGEDPTRVLGAVQEYDVRSGRWSSLGAMRTPRHGMAVLAAGDTVYALDGARAPGHVRSTDLADALDLP